MENQKNEQQIQPITVTISKEDYDRFLKLESKEQKQSNPSAFPSESNDSDYKGMTLRDYFSAKAMQGIISNEPLRMYYENYRNKSEDEAKDLIAKVSYNIADAMLKQREL